MTYTHICFIVTLVLNTLVFDQSYCQENNQSQLQTILADKIGKDPVLVNGRYFENIYSRDLGTPFFINESFQNGYVIINQIYYSDIKLKYNVFEHNLVINHAQSNEQISYIPPNDFISEFSLYNRVFRKYSFEKTGTPFLEVVYDGNIKCLYAWKKNRSESNHNGNYSAFKYYPEKKKMYLLKNSTLIRYNSKGSFIKAFSKEYKKDINEFIRSNSIKLKKASNEQISELVSFCQGLSSNPIVTNTYTSDIE